MPNYMESNFEKSDIFIDYPITAVYSGIIKNVIGIKILIPDQGIHFLGLNIIHLFNSILYLLLVGTNVNNENQSVVVFNFLHCRLSGERIFENLILVKLVP